MKYTSEEVLRFWFEDSSNKDWFGGKKEFDDRLRSRFPDLLSQVAAGEAWGWRNSPEGRLAEIIVLDQFSRQLYRGEAQAFAQDAMALTLAQEMVARGDDLKLGTEKRMFAYMPYLHSESLIIHAESLRLFTALESESMLKYEKLHSEVLEKFGRYPKRNEALGRKSTPEELVYINEKNGMF